MKLTCLLSNRERLLREAALANEAFAYVTLCRLVARVRKDRLVGLVSLIRAEPGEEGCLGALKALEGSQSVLEEHFSEEDVTDMADAVWLATGANCSEMRFRIEEMEELFAAPLRASLSRSGVTVDLELDRSSAGRAQKD